MGNRSRFRLLCCLGDTPTYHDGATATSNNSSARPRPVNEPNIHEQPRYDVFLSFRGEDTRHSFTDHLYDALMRAGIRVFRDNNEIDIGQELSLEIASAIKASEASIVILSKNYATSTWCLDELCLILEQRRECNHFVLPVFYEVDPSDVRKQNNTFNIRVQTSTRWTDDNMSRWKAALTHIANLTGEVVSGSETQLLKKVVDTIYSRLDRKQVYLPLNLIGMDVRVEEINHWLNQSGAEFLVICGMGGSGKSTLAQYIVYSNWQYFENISIVECIGSRCKEANGLLYLQKQLFKDILGGKNRRIPSVCQGAFKIEEVLQTKRALILLDDIVKPSQLDALLGAGNINKQSKIIITTMENDIGVWFRSRSRRYQEYKMKLLDDHESLELLCLHAFGSKNPMEGYEELAKEVVRYCEGNPLALEVLGSSLSEDINISYWKSTLTLLGKDIHHDIFSVLKKSYDSLPYDSDRELFLHIACFFVGTDIDYVVKILEPDYSAVSRIKILIKRCLVYVAPNNKVMMHRLLQEMGRNIVDRESPIPAHRTRVWRNEESYDLLRNIRSSIKMKGLALDMHELMEEVDKFKCEQIGFRLPTDSLQEMDQLKLLQLNYVEHVSSYKDLSEHLRWVCWHGFNHGNIISHLPLRNLVTLDMSYSLLITFEPPTVLQSLKILNLKSSQNLLEVCNISHLPNLETLILWNCHNLERVCETIKDLTGLGILNMTGCESMRQSFSFPHSVERLFLKDCSVNCTNDFPLTFTGQTSLQYLNLGNNLFEHLPSYTHLKNLRVLDLSMCSKLIRLQGLPSTLAELYIYYCESLEKVAFESHQFALQEFGYEGCSNLCEVEGFIKLVPLAKLDELDLGHMKWLKGYQDQELCLAGDDELMTGRSRQLQMLYEFNIMSTSLLDIKDLNMKPDYLSKSTALSFAVPLCPKDRWLKGLNISFKYSISGDQDWDWFVKISTSNGVDLIYNPKVFGKPGPDEVAIWISYFPIGNKLTDGDQVSLFIVVLSGLDIQQCGASLVYGYCESSNDTLRKDEEWVEILGGDFSRFQLSTGAYYLCRRDYFELREIGRLTPGWFSILVGDTIDDTEIRGWRKTGRPQQLCQSYTELKIVRCIVNGPQLEDIYKIAEMSASSFVYKSMELALGLGGETSKSGTTSEFVDATTEPQVGFGSLRIVSSSPRERRRPDVYISINDLDDYYFGDYLKKALRREDLWVSPTDPQDRYFWSRRTNDDDPKELPGQARASIIVLSESYVNSHEHLDELLMIHDEMRNSSHFVLPIFYRIESSNIKENGKDLLLRSFRGSNELLRKVDRWHKALVQVSDLPNIYFPRTFKDDDDVAGIKEVVNIVKYVSTRYGIRDVFFKHIGLY